MAYLLVIDLYQPERAIFSRIKLSELKYSLKDYFHHAALSFDQRSLTTTCELVKDLEYLGMNRWSLLWNTSVYKEIVTFTENGLKGEIKDLDLLDIKDS